MTEERRKLLQSRKETEKARQAERADRRATKHQSPEPAYPLAYSGKIEGLMPYLEKAIEQTVSR